MSQQNPAGEPLVGEVRFRVPLPIVIPILGLAIIAALAIGFSQVLLALPKEAAVVVAIATAANALGVCAFMALRKRVSGTTVMELGAILAYPVIIGIAIAALNIGEGAGHGEAAAAQGEEASGGAEGGGLAVTTQNFLFEPSALTVPAGEEVSLAYSNEDTAEHNIAVYPDQAAGLEKTDAIFQGEVIQPGGSTTYDIPAVKKGEYYFQCDVHPNMNGPYTAE
ncbi:MAG: cupredoxin domain-containing protein [Actinomycetota bacterium]